MTILSSWTVRQIVSTSNLALFSAVNASGDKSRLPYAAECARDAVSDLPAEQIRQCEMLRDILGNPFQRVHFDHSWQTSSAVAIVKQMYESRDFSAMPILADALEEAGCDNEAILNHCRDEGQVHVRGCWVVDGVLGKS